MSLDALILADHSTDSVSGSSPMRLTINGRSATIQTVFNYLEHNGKIVPPVAGDNLLSWSSAYKLNGIALLSDLLQNGYSAALIDRLDQGTARFKELLEKKPRAIVVSTSFIVNKAALNGLINTIRKLAPETPIIAGGPFVFQSYLIRQRRDEPEFAYPELKKDFLFWHEEEPDINLYVTALRGQQALHRALDRLRSKAALHGIPDTAWRDEHGCYQFGSNETTTRARTEDRIDWGSLPEEIFASQVVPLQASSGCPHRCAFCNFVKDHHNTYAKSIDQIVAEMTAVARRGVKYIWFVDDIFRLGRGDLSATSKAIIAADLDIKWMTFIRADTVKQVDFSLLKKAGCHELQFGLESADPSVLEAMNKKADPEIYRTSIEKALAAGINVSAYFLFGHPGETTESLERTIAFMRQIQFPDLPGSLSWSIYPFLLVPLSPIYEAEQRQQYDLRGYLMEWQHRTMNFKRAMQGIHQAVQALQESAPIYRADNLEMLDKLDDKRRKAFFRARLHLAKLAAARKLGTDTIFRTFSDILVGP